MSYSHYDYAAFHRSLMQLTSFSFNLFFLFLSFPAYEYGEIVFGLAN